MREPSLHQGVIPFPRRDRGVLRTPAQRLQPAGQVVRMVVHPKGHQNHRTDAPERQSIGVNASLEGPLCENYQHTWPLLNPQAGRAARNGACLQAGHIALVLAELSSPCADSHPTHP